MNFIAEVEKVSRQLPRRSPPVPVGHPLIGRIGMCIPDKGFRIQGMSARSFNALMRDEEKFRNAPQKLVKRALRELGAITNWDGVLAARAGGKADDFMGYKASLTTVANQWSSFFQAGGLPAAGSYDAIPGGGTKNGASTGAFPLINPTPPDAKYLLVPGGNHLTGTNIVMLVDLLLGAGNISTNSAGDQVISSSALTRYTDGVGVMMTIEITVVSGAGASNVTLTYTNQAGTGSRTTGALAMTASCIAYRLQPVSGGAMIPLQSGDYGVQSVETFNLSGAMGAGGTCAILLYKPLWIFPTLGSTFWVEPSTPQMLSGITELVTEVGGDIGCLTFFVNTSTTSTGVQTYMLRTCMG